MVLTVPAHAVTADDLVPLDDPAYSALDYLQREGYLSWLPDGYFVPACHGGQLRSSLNIALNVALLKYDIRDKGAPCDVLDQWQRLMNWSGDERGLNYNSVEGHSLSLNDPLPSENWAYPALTWLVQQEFLREYAPNFFSGDQPRTCQVFADALKLIDAKIENYGAPQRVQEIADRLRAELPCAEHHAWDDVPADDWAYCALTDLSERGVLEGYPAGFFDARKPLTRYEFAMAVSRCEHDIAAKRAGADDLEVLRRLRAQFTPEILPMHDPLY